MRPEPHSTPTTLIDVLLAEQKQLGAAEIFSHWHDSETGLSKPGIYRGLIPIQPPGKNEQLAFEVDLDRCSGCKGCVTACHSMNGLEPGETWRSVGLLVGPGIESELPDHSGTGCGLPAISEFVQQTVTTACHHCLDPACLNGCPVLAYDKDPATGIVRHLDDQCIGCSYCTFTCPYEVPQYSKSKGIVRKCDMCHGRLAEGEEPACVQGCPNEAIRIVIRNVESIHANTRTNTAQLAWLPDSPDQSLTLPTTLYRSSIPNQHLKAADHHRTRIAPAHWPLILMLALTQCGIGAVLFATFLGLPESRATLASGLLLFVIGLSASIFHLGQPSKAWRIGLGWRKSWLSREAMVLPPFALIAAAMLLPNWFPISLLPNSTWTILLCISGAVALFAQSMVYAATHRPSWRLKLTLPKFVLTSILLGASLTLAWTGSLAMAALTAVAAMAKLFVEFNSITSALRQASTPAFPRSLVRSARIAFGPLRSSLVCRGLLALAGGVAVPLIHMQVPLPFPLLLTGFLLALAGELLERRAFFMASAPDLMPGSIDP